MSAQIEFYFDFISPYGYLGSLGIEEIAARCDARVDWRPMLLGVSVMRVMGLKPLGETPLKGPYAAHDFQRCFRLLGVPYVPADGTMAPLPAGRAFSWLKDRDDELAVRFAQRVYRAQWSEGRDLSSASALAELGRELDIDPDALVKALADPAVKARHRERVDESLARSVFGSPSFLVNGELFWGHDRLAQVERWVETGGW